MNLKSKLFVFLTLMGLLSCKNEKTAITKKELNQIVVIAIDAPKHYSHLVERDSIGKKLKDSLGPKSFSLKNGFSYLDYLNTVQTWRPKPNTRDTLIIECYSDYLELSTNNFFSSIKDSFLVKKGDTVVITYQHNIAKATITNRKVNDQELNYNAFRHHQLFQNKYTSHYLIFGHWFNQKNPISEWDAISIEFYREAQNDYWREQQLLDSLFESNLISKVNYHYRKAALEMLMEKHKQLIIIKNWIEQNKSLKNEESLETVFEFDLSMTDSLMKFSFFRDYLNYISKYNLEFIREVNENSGGFYIDSRIRFDSILKDKRFNQTAQNFLLFEAYQGIGQNFSVRDKEQYFEKLVKHTTNKEQLMKLVKEYQLDFSKSDQMILTNIDQDTTNYATVLQQHKGRWLYVDFWASWCKPCIEIIPESKKLQEELKDEPITFLYFSLNDNKEKWKATLQANELVNNQNYFIENGNASQVIEELGIRNIPHYLIYNPDGKLVNGYAKRPGKGASETLSKLMN